VTPGIHQVVIFHSGLTSELVGVVSDFAISAILDKAQVHHSLVILDLICCKAVSLSNQLVVSLSNSVFKPVLNFAKSVFAIFN